MSAVITKARRIASNAHAGQFDRQGVPYIEHPLRVSRIVSGFFFDEDPLLESAQTTAILHDVIEDGSVSAGDLVSKGIAPLVVDDVVRLTKTPAQSRESYLEQITHSRIALAVKIADIADNTDPERWIVLEEEVKEQYLAKYGYYVCYLLDRAKYDYCGAAIQDHPLARMLQKRLAEFRFAV